MKTGHNFRMQPSKIILFPATGMACPEVSCNTPVFGRYEGLVTHWKTIHNLYVEIYRCQLCGRQFKRGTDANWHLRQGHNTGTDVNRVRNCDFIPAQGEILRQPSVVISTPSTSESTPSDHQQARHEAQAARQQIKEEEERGPAVPMTNPKVDSVFPEERFTLVSPEPDVLDLSNS